MIILLIFCYALTVLNIGTTIYLISERDWYAPIATCMSIFCITCSVKVTFPINLPRIEMVPCGKKRFDKIKAMMIVTEESK